MVQKIATNGRKEIEPQLEQFARFERETAAGQPGWLSPLRQSGIKVFAEKGFPTLEDEDWRFTNVAPVAHLPFNPVWKLPEDASVPRSVESFMFGGVKSHRLVFVNGHYHPGLSSPGTPGQGVTVTSLAAALVSGSDVLEKHLAQSADERNNSFTALNTAFFQDGAFVHIPAGKVVETPIHLLFISSVKESGATAHPRNLFVVEASSQATILETHASSVNAPYFTNVVTDLVLGQGARLEYCKFQGDSPSAFHLASLRARLGRDASLRAHSFAMGAALSRNTIHAILDGEGADCVLNGLYLTRSDQVADHHMVVEHAQPHCTSHEYFNGILDDRSKGVFHGRILVKPAAQKTDAKQTNRNLLLSEEATIDTKPQLEIYADDVKCTHGATVGQLNEESIFYLRARGIGAETARRMLIHAFAGEITERVQHVPAREELDRLVWARLEANPQVCDGKPS
jgi:Fe-S cluster assembly protein SufD